MPPICVPRAPGQMDKGCLHPNTVALHSERTRAYNRLAFKEHPDEWTKAGAVASSYLADGSIVATRLGPNGWYWNTILCMKRWKGMLRTHSRSHARTHTHTCRHARAHTHVYMCTHMHTRTHTHTCVGPVLLGRTHKNSNRNAQVLHVLWRRAHQAGCVT